jgi:hypothetical protein
VHDHRRVTLCFMAAHRVWYLFIWCLFGIGTFSELACTTTIVRSSTHLCVGDNIPDKIVSRRRAEVEGQDQRTRYDTPGLQHLFPMQSKMRGAQQECSGADHTAATARFALRAAAERKASHSLQSARGSRLSSCCRPPPPSSRDKPIHLAATVVGRRCTVGGASCRCRSLDSAPSAARSALA